MVRSLIAGIAVILTGAAGANAQEELRPKEPVSPKAPDNAYWKVTTRYKTGGTVSENGQDKPRTSVRTVRKVKQLLQEIMDYDGKRYESYIIGGLRIGDHGEKDTVISIPPTDAKFAYYGDADFARMEWLSMKHFKEVGEHEGKKVFVFRISADDPDALTAGDAVAMLDVETQLPVYYSDSQIEETYEFMSPPSTQIVIPEIFQKRLVRELQYIQDLKRAGGG